MTDILQEIAAMEKRIAEIKSIVIAEKQAPTKNNESGKTDKALLHECLDALQQATYHDGRYDQFLTDRWQGTAQDLVQILAKRLGRVAYEGF